VTNKLTFSETSKINSLFGQFTPQANKNVGFAGNKDKRGITVQICSIRDVLIGQLASVTNLERGIRLGLFRQSISEVGENSGNRFEIVLRNLKSSQSEVTRRLNGLRSTGFLNHIGMQRFGIGSVSTHHIGIPVLKRDWKKLVETLLDPDSENPEEVRKAKRVYRNMKDAGKRLKFCQKVRRLSIQYCRLSKR
jgi:tRNA pseudouridine13 synthase